MIVHWVTNAEVVHTNTYVHIILHTLLGCFGRGATAGGRTQVAPAGICLVLVLSSELKRL